MNNALILLLGNRDVQVVTSQLDLLPSNIANHLVRNNDSAEGTYVIDKSSQSGATFFQLSQLIASQLEEVYQWLDFPLLNATLAELNQEGQAVQHVYLTTSAQSPPHPQDGSFFAEILLHPLTQLGYACSLRLCDRNPTDFAAMTDFYDRLFSEVEQAHDRVFVSNSGGTPAMRSASHFAGIFRGFQYITISSSNRANLNTFARQERMILHKIVRSMLERYDYQGLLQLPIQNETIKQLARYAQARIALNFTVAQSIALESKEADAFFAELHGQLDQDLSKQQLGREMFLSAKIKFYQGSYSDYLWRLFTIYENLMIDYAEQILGGPIEYQPKTTEHESWKTLLQAFEQRSPGFLHWLGQRTVRDTPLDYSEPNKFTYLEIIRYAQEQTPPLLEVTDQLFLIVQCLDQVNWLRNDAAHRYKGFGVEQINDELPRKLLGIDRRAHRQQGTIRKFNELLANFLGLDWTDFGIYHKINTQILELFDKEAP